MRALFIIILSLSCSIAFGQQMPPGVQQLLPDGYSVLKAVKGDLNLDSIPDWLIVLHKKGEDSINNPVPARPLLIVLGQPKQSFEIAKRNDSIIYTRDMGGASNSEPLGNVTINNGVFTIEFWGGVGTFHWNKVLAFQYKSTSKDWYLKKVEYADGNTVIDSSGNVVSSEGSDSTRTAALFGQISLNEYNFQTNNEERDLPSLDSGFTNKAEAKNLMVNGKKEGKWCDYKDSAFKITTDTSALYYQLTIYKNDKKNGHSRLYRKNGTLRSEALFRDGKIIGAEKDYYKNGILEKYIPYKNDDVDGIERDYDSTGRLVSEQGYLRGYKTFGYDDIAIQVSCSIDGETSNEIYIVGNLVKAKNDTGLVKLLYEGDITLRFLAVLAIEDILQKRKIALSEEETKIIRDFKTRKDDVHCCEGCTIQFHSTVEEVFNKPNLQLRRLLDGEVSIK